GRVVGREKLSVRAGAFEAWKVVVGIQADFGRVEMTYWYAAEPRRLGKFQSRTISSNRSRVGNIGSWSSPDMNMELVSYAPAAGGAAPAKPAGAAAIREYLLSQVDFVFDGHCGTNANWGDIKFAQNGSKVTAGLKGPTTFTMSDVAITDTAFV